MGGWRAEGDRGETASMRKIACLLALFLSLPAFADGTITWCDAYKVKAKDSPTDVVNFAEGIGKVHAGDTYQLGSRTGNKLLFWLDFSPPLQLDSSDGIHLVWVQQKDDGSEFEMQNQRIGGCRDTHNLAFDFIPYSVPGRYLMKIVRLSDGQPLARPRQFILTQ